MKVMKKKRLIFLALVMMFLLTACQLSHHDTSSDRNDSRTNSSVVSDQKHSSPESGEEQTTGASTKTDNEPTALNGEESSKTTQESIDWYAQATLTAQELENIGGEKAGSVYMSEQNGSEQRVLLLPGSGGMGQVGYIPFFTVDNGQTWQRGKEFAVLGGLGVSHCLEDGSALCFATSGHTLPDHPYVRHLVFDYDNLTATCEYLNHWFDFFGIDKDTIIDIESEYLDDYRIHIVIYEINDREKQLRHTRNGKLLFDGDVILDPETLYPIGTEEHQTVFTTEELSAMYTGNPWSSRDVKIMPETDKQVRFVERSIGMHSVGGYTYFSFDGGQTWWQGGLYQVSLGSRREYNLEDERILYFANSVVSENKRPWAEVWTLDFDNLSVQRDHINDWFDIFGFDENTIINPVVKEIDGYTMHMVIYKVDDWKYQLSTDAVNGEVLFDGRVMLDEETLKPVEVLHNMTE